MSYVKRIVCLANSRRHSGRCIAGKEILERGYGSWIRPVSARPTREVSEEERRFENGQDPRLLDIIDVSLIAYTPVLHQSENHVIDEGSYWAKVGRLPWTEVENLVDKRVQLWPNGDSTYHGRNDRVSLQLASKMTTSLMLIEPETLSIHVGVEGAEFGNPRRRVRADLKHLRTRYNMVVTDPIAERVFLGRADGEYPVGDAYVCVSLSEAHIDGYCYKLVASLLSEKPL